MDEPVAIIGGGISGIAAAQRLEEVGIRSIIFEKEEEIGGRAITLDGAMPFDMGAQFLIHGYREIEHVCAESGLAEEFIEIPTHEHCIFYDGKIHSAGFSSYKDFFRQSHLSTLSRLRLPFLYFFAKRAGPSLDFFNLSQAPSHLYERWSRPFLRRWIGEEGVEKVVDAIVRGYHFHSIDRLSLATLLSCFDFLFPSFFYRTIKGGIGMFARRLSTKLSLRLSCEVSLVSQIENGIELSFSKGVKERFQHVIFALPAPDLSRIAKTLFPKTKLLLQSVQYASTIVIAFWIPADAFPKEKIVLVPKQESSLIVSYCNQGCKYPPYGDKSLIVLFLEDRAARSLMQESDELIFMKVREELIPCCPPLGKIAKSAIEPYKLKRWKRAMPIFSPNHFRLVHELLEEEKRNPSITLCGDYLNAPWIEGAFRSGRAAADRLIDKISLRV